MKLSKFTIALFLSQALLSDLAGTNKVLCSAIALEQTFQEGDTSNEKGSTSSPGLRGHRIIQTISKQAEDEEVESEVVPLLYYDNKLQGTNNTDSETSDNLFEGDIIADYDFIMENYGPDVVEKLEAEGLIEEPLHNDTFSVLSLHTSRRWKNRVNGVVEVPYQISSKYSSTDVKDIHSAVRELGDRSKVVKFVQRTSQADYIQVEPNGSCSSWVGKQGGRQVLSLASRRCFRKGTIQHEFLHAIGMFHEQSRPDRDSYVTINYGNIKSGKEGNFRKVSWSETLGNPYDYGSVMHYGRDAFSKNGRDTITPKNGASIGQRNGASNQDIIDMRLMYQCASGPRTLSEYNANRCTSDCKCWDGEAGCNGNNDLCQGSMVCSNNRCSRGGSSGYSKKFMLINPQTGKALDVDGAKCDDGTNIHLWDVNRSDAQIFHYHFDSKAIVNVKCNKAVDISRFQCNDGANIWLWKRNGSGAQKFSFYNDMTIRSAGCENKAIDIYKAASDNGTNILSWSKHGNANQKWQIKYI